MKNICDKITAIVGAHSHFNLIRNYAEKFFQRWSRMSSRNQWTKT